MRLKMVARTGHPDFLDLPWSEPLASWDSERLVEVDRGISRHVVRFVAYDSNRYALKELPARLAHREYRLLQSLADDSIPAVKAVGVVERTLADGSLDRDSDAILITQHLDRSRPYRALFSERGDAHLKDRLLDALAELLVRLHLAGFFWGDCSLSNALFRRDAGRLAAYLVDAETGELHDELSDGQRTFDIEIARSNLAGELMDLEASGDLPGDIDPVDTASEVGRRYGELWNELTHEEVFGPDERYRIDARLRRLNDLGFDVRELELSATDDGIVMRLDTQVVLPGHHARRLLALTGLSVQENQARRLLHDIAGFRAHLERTEETAVPEEVAAARWLLEVYRPVLGRLPDEALGAVEPAEAFHEILEHRWYRSESEGRDVPLMEAVGSYASEVLGIEPPAS